MKKIYMTPEMEILDAEMEGFLAASNLLGKKKENGFVDETLSRQGDFDDFDEEEF